MDFVVLAVVFVDSNVAAVVPVADGTVFWFSPLCHIIEEAEPDEVMLESESSLPKSSGPMYDTVRTTRHFQKYQ